MPSCEAKRDGKDWNMVFCPRAKAIAAGQQGLPPCLYPDLAEGVSCDTSRVASDTARAYRESCFGRQRKQLANK